MEIKEGYMPFKGYQTYYRIAGEVTEESPECLRRPKKSGAEAYLHGWEPNEYNPTGTLRDYDYTERLHEIKVPCLVMSGTDDLCTPLEAWLEAHD